jgi:hypothetical protein
MNGFMPGLFFAFNQIIPLAFSRIMPLPRPQRKGFEGETPPLT